MAHYIAETMQAAEVATGDDRNAKLKTCAEAILTVWEHRNALQSGVRPLEDCEPMIETLKSLDPRENVPRYFRAPRMAAQDDTPEPEAVRWLETAEGLDYAARILIRYSLARAVEGSADKSKKWVELAEASTAKPEPCLTVVRAVLDEAEMLVTPELTDTERQDAEYRIQCLQTFIEMATGIVEELRAKLH
jgi:hypothetical protein